MCPGVPAELPAQRPAGGREGPVQGGAALGGPENPDGSQTQAEGGQAAGNAPTHLEWSIIDEEKLRKQKNKADM